ncbi:hypothetical protein PIB30_095418 [Stylosanthes scabra]|uniref:Uncharacterized protein n=1 Tax=Stylosanthes scabra TaxID=79078 RepID=A0ABU6TV74_9FABA|nr:hypothetical protein [Stylosanthes scabra]
MAAKSYIDIQVVTLMCHVLNADEDEQFEKLIYCIPPEILQRMFATQNQNWMDKKNRRPHEISSLLNHTEFLAYLDKEKLNSHRFGNKDKQALSFDPEIEKTLRKLRKQAKLQEHIKLLRDKNLRTKLVTTWLAMKTTIEGRNLQIF